MNPKVFDSTYAANYKRAGLTMRVETHNSGKNQLFEANPIPSQRINNMAENALALVGFQANLKPNSKTKSETARALWQNILLPLHRV